MRKLLIGTIGLCILSGCGLSEASRDQPNVLIVVLDALRADHVGCYGYERNTTPNIDAFARKAVVYRNAFACCSWTKPSVTSLLTGMNCREHGVHIGFDSLPESVPYLPSALGAAGYTTGAFLNTCFMLESKQYGRGFDSFWHLFPDLRIATDLWNTGTVVDPDDAAVVNQVIPWLRAAQDPWFCYVHLIGPHTPYRARIEPELYGDHPVDLYDGKLCYADAQLGRLLAAVPLGTVVIITADHGEEFGEHGGKYHGRTLHDEVLHVPLIIRWPGQEPRVETGLVGLDRIAPALLEGKLPETGGEVRCDLEKRYPDGRIKKRLKRIITEADIDPDHTPAVDADALRREQLEALGYS